MCAVLQWWIPSAYQSAMGARPEIRRRYCKHFDPTRSRPDGQRHMTNKKGNCVLYVCTVASDAHPFWMGPHLGPFTSPESARTALVVATGLK